jgi:hypothetical protein
MSRWGRLAETLDDAQRAAVGLADRGRQEGVNPNALLRLRESFEKVRYARSSPSVLRASGVKIQRMSAENMRIVAGNRQPWQSLAWRYRDMIGELRFGLRYRSNALSRVRFYVAEIIDDDDEPIPVSLRHDDDPEKAKRITLPEDFCRAAEEELNRLPLDAGYEFLGIWSENFDVAGDCWLHGFTNPLTGEEEWKIRSVESVDVQGASLTVKNELGQPRKINLDEEELYRLWIPHPAHPHLGDSALNALSDVLEDICLTGRELRAVARSRIMANGALLVPESMASVANTREEDDSPEARRAMWMSNLEAAMLAPIANEGDAGGVVPLVLTGSKEDIEAVRQLTFAREESPILLEKLRASLGRMGNSLDIPPEILTGMADANHWTAWQIDNSTFRHHLEPGIRLMVDALTGSFLRTALKASGFPAELLKRVRIWYDAGQITENPNRRQDALDALDHILIGPAAGREALGFNDGDAPTPEEALQLIAAKNGVDQSTAAAILAWAARQEGATDLPDFPAPAQLPPGQTAPVSPGGQVEPDDAAPGGAGVPSTAPDGIAASARPADVVPFIGTPGQINAKLQGATFDAQFLDGHAYRLDVTAARDLGDIDTALRDQILAAADQAAKQALRRAGSRLRSKATSPKLDDATRARLQSVNVEHWAAVLGPEQCLALNADQRFLLAGAWEALSGKFGGWVRAAIGKVSKRVLRMTRTAPDSLEGRHITRTLQAEMEARIDGAWANLEDGMTAHLERVIFGTDDGTDTPGEMPDLDIPPRLVRDALAEIGGDQTAEGLPVTGLGNGSSVRGTLQDRGALHVGLEWRYGYMPRNTFLPHENLDGQRFLGWTDDVLATQPDDAWIGPFYHPGDHAGCLCSWLTVYALPEGGTPTLVLDRQTLQAGPQREALVTLQREFLQGDLFEPATQPMVADTQPAAKEGHAALAAAPLDLNDPKLQVNGMVGIDSERDEIQLYKGVAYTPTNQYLREGAGEFLRERVEKMDDAISKSKLTSDVIVHRGVKDPRAFMGDLVDGDLTGLEWIDDAYLSTSADLRIADRFANQSDSPDGGMVLNIRVGKGATMLRLSGFAPADATLNDTSPEAELLGGRGWQMRVVADHGKDAGGIRRVDVEVVSHARNAQDPWSRD